VGERGQLEARRRACSVSTGVSEVVCAGHPTRMVTISDSAAHSTACVGACRAIINNPDPWQREPWAEKKKKKKEARRCCSKLPFYYSPRSACQYSRHGSVLRARTGARFRVSRLEPLPRISTSSSAGAASPELNPSGARVRDASRPRSFANGHLLSARWHRMRAARPHIRAADGPVSSNGMFITSRRPTSCDGSCACWSGGARSKASGCSSSTHDRRRC